MGCPSKRDTAGLVFSSGGLKAIAMACMVMDHVACYLLPAGDAAVLPMRLVGRVSFPVFALLIGEGYVHTRDRVRYGLSLLVFALVSEIPWQLLRGDGTHNVMFTLLAGFLGIALLDFARTRLAGGGNALDCLPAAVTAGILVFILGLFCMCCRTDYGHYGYMLVVCLHLLRHRRTARAVSGLCLMARELLPGQLLAFVLVHNYNGQRGFLPSGRAKYIFYAFYPIHLLVIWAVRTRTS